MSRKIILSVLAFAATLAAAAQDPQTAAEQAVKALEEAPAETVQAPKPKFWKESVMTQINFVQSSFSNWAKGGTNNYTMSAYVDANANYAKENISWKNRLQLDFGFMFAEDKPILQKNKDRILLESTWGMTAARKLNYSATFTFLSQFTDGFLYNTPAAGKNATRKEWLDARDPKSSFLAPGTATLGLGVDWAPFSWLNVNFAPVTGGFTIVTDTRFRDAYGMKLKERYADESVVLGHMYRPARFEFGMQVKSVAAFKVNDNFEAGSQLILFSNYLDKPQNIRVNWDNRLMWKLARFFSLNITTNLIYDDTVKITDEDHPEGYRVTQFAEALQFGFTYTFTSK